jgi:hypothetical protein
MMMKPSVTPARNKLDMIDAYGLSGLLIFCQITMVVRAGHLMDSFAACIDALS